LLLSGEVSFPHKTSLQVERQDRDWAYGLWESECQRASQRAIQGLHKQGFYGEGEMLNVNSVNHLFSYAFVPLLDRFFAFLIDPHIHFLSGPPIGFALLAYPVNVLP